MKNKAIHWVVAVLAGCFFAGAQAAEKMLGPGDMPPPRLGVDRDGNVTETGTFAGKVLIVTFWATWCGPCLKELPMLEGIQRAGGKERVQVVAINIEDRDRFRKAARALSRSLTLAMNHDSGKEASEAFGVHGIPHCVIIGRDGRIMNVHRGYSEEALDSIIAEINRALAAKQPR